MSAVAFILKAVADAARLGDTAAVISFAPGQVPLTKVCSILRETGYRVEEFWDEGYIVVDWTFKGEG